MIGLAGNEMAEAARDAFNSLLSVHHTIARTRALREDGIGYDPALWKLLASEGWLGARVPETNCGVGLEAVAAAASADLVGTRLLPEPLLAMGWFPARLLSNGLLGVAAIETLVHLISGEIRVAVAWQEKAGCVDAVSGTTEFAEGRLRGEKRFVIGGADADVLLVTARDGDGHGVFLADARQAGVTIERVRQIDGSVAATVHFRDVDASRMADDLVAFDAALDETRVMAAVQLLAIAREALRITIDYAGTRRQFGKAIGSFQALQHRMVDYATRIRLGEVACDAALAAIDSDNPDARTIARLACAAKASAADTAVAVTQGAIQLHGAIGYTDEADIGLYLATALRLAPWLGTADALRSRFLDLGGAAGNA